MRRGRERERSGIAIRADAASLNNSVDTTQILPVRPPVEQHGHWPMVLLVEDDPDTQESMRAVLGQHFRIVAVRSAEEARHQLAEHQDEVRMILMDFSLQGAEDGLTLTR